jgi:tagatose 6-phosphate kinase
MRFATLTLHPALDRLVETARVKPGAVLDVRLQSIVPAGKGTNTARVLKVLSRRPVRTAAWIGAGEALFFRAGLRRAGLAVALCPRPCLTRQCLTLFETETGRETHLKECMPPPSPAEERALLRFLRRLNLRGAALAVCGSAPPGTRRGTLDRILSILRAQVRILIVDSSGPLLDAAGRARVDGLKGNAAEIGAWLRLGSAWRPESASHRRALRAALARRGGPAAVLITRGAHGAALATPDRTWTARPPRIPLRSIASAIGCGDAATAGWLSAWAQGLPPAAALARATACGTAKLLSPDPGTLNPRHVRRFARLIRPVRL